MVLHHAKLRATRRALYIVAQYSQHLILICTALHRAGRVDRLDDWPAWPGCIFVVFVYTVTHQWRHLEARPCKICVCLMVLTTRVTRCPLDLAVPTTVDYADHLTMNTAHLLRLIGKDSFGNSSRLSLKVLRKLP